MNALGPCSRTAAPGPPATARTPKCPFRQHQQRLPAARSFADNQSLRFKHVYKPEDSGSPNSWMSWPAEQATEPNSYIQEQQPDERISPESLWPPRSSPDSISLSNPYAQKFRVTPAPVPVPISLPGTEYWYVEALNDYTREWPSLRFTQGRLQLRLGFLKFVDDPKSVPFFFYKGLQQVRYTWGDRAFQLLYTAVYAGVHAALFCFLWGANQALAAAVALNWGLGSLSLGKWGLLLLLASAGKLWLYFVFLGAKLLDAGLARLLPPVRKFFWANFTLWMLYLLLSPSHWPIIPFWPLAPGSYGPIEAVG